jgi:glycosyltransferase involved in cell wall biosynthesis
MYGGIMADRVITSTRDIPVLVSFCGSDLLGENLSGIPRRLVSRFGVWCSHRAARRAAGIIVKSRNLQNALPRGIPESRIRVLPNGVDLDRFFPQNQEVCSRQLGWNQNAFHVLFPANRKDPVKRPNLAREAVERLKALGVRAELHLLKEVPHHQVPLWLNAAHAILLTSKQEGSPNIVKEALACNVPVVSVEVGDVAERIQDIEGCYLASPEPADLAAKLWDVSQRRGRVDSRNRISDCSLGQVAQRLCEFYNETISTWMSTR